MGQKGTLEPSSWAIARAMAVYNEMKIVKHKSKHVSLKEHKKFTGYFCRICFLVAKSLFLSMIKYICNLGLF